MHQVTWISAFVMTSLATLDRAALLATAACLVVLAEVRLRMILLLRLAILPVDIAEALVAPEALVEVAEYNNNVAIAAWIRALRRNRILRKLSLVRKRNLNRRNMRSAFIATAWELKAMAA